MIQQCNKELVLIEPDKAEEKTESGIILPELVKENLNKKQNRGKVLMIGESVEWPAVDAYVSFYRNAATPIVEDGKEYLLIHNSHILCKFGGNHGKK